MGGCRFNPDCRWVANRNTYHLYKVMTNRTGDPRGFNKGHSSVKVPLFEEVRKTYWPKHCWNKNEDNSQKTFSVKISEMGMFYCLHYLESKTLVFILLVISRTLKSLYLPHFFWCSLSLLVILNKFGIKSFI